MDELWEKIAADWPGTSDLLDTAFRLPLAIVVGELPGFEHNPDNHRYRQRGEKGRPAP